MGGAVFVTAELPQLPLFPCPSLSSPSMPKATCDSPLFSLRPRSGSRRPVRCSLIARAADTRPAGRIRPSTLFYSPGSLFLPGGSAELLAPS